MSTRAFKAVLQKHGYVDKGLNKETSYGSREYAHPSGSVVIDHGPLGPSKSASKHAWEHLPHHEAPETLNSGIGHHALNTQLNAHHNAQHSEELTVDVTQHEESQVRHVTPEQAEEILKDSRFTRK